MACWVVRHRTGTLSATIVFVLAVSASAQDVQMVPGSTTPRVQLTGEHFQAQAGDTYFSAPTASATLSRAGVVGTDLGLPLTVGGRTLLFFGDTVGAYRNGDRYYGSRGNPSGSGDSIGWLADGDFSACRYVADVVEQLARGVAQPVADASACPSLTFFQNVTRGVDEHVFKPFVIAGLEADESQATFRVPTSVVHLNDRVYVFATTRFQDATPAAAFWLQSVVARSDQPPALWSDTNPPAFRRLYTVSSHAAIEDAANPPALDTEPGKFMGVPAVLVEAVGIADLGLNQFLPRELQNIDVVFLFGRGWHTTRSDMYLAAVAARDFEAGPSKWFYFAGNGRWSASEREATGLLRVDDVSMHHSVGWNSALGRFVLLRGATGRVVAQFAEAPWGPWSAPITIVSPADDWVTRLLHRPGGDRIVQSLVPIYNRDGTQMAMPDEERGVPYAPNLLDRFTENAEAGTVTLYYTLSGWNPYQVFLVSTTFRRDARR